jgi:hypothetical protein
MIRRTLALAACLALAAAGTRTATGTFDVHVTPEGPPVEGIQALTLHKTFTGDLQGTSIGTMLGARSAVQGSAGYVALEHVDATLAGHHGSFVLQHHGTMRAGKATLAVDVLPDSGTDGLAGLTGTMAIDVDPAGRHHYTFTYNLPDHP